MNLRINNMIYPDIVQRVWERKYYFVLELQNQPISAILTLHFSIREP